LAIEQKAALEAQSLILKDVAQYRDKAKKWVLEGLEDIRKRGQRLVPAIGIGCLAEHEPCGHEKWI